MPILNQEQKKDLVIKFLNMDYSYRQIQRKLHVSPAFITKVKKELLGEEYVFKNQPTKISKNTQAIDLIRNGTNLMDIALKLNLDSNEIHKAYYDYLKLNNLHNFADLISPESREKFNLLLKTTNILHQKGTTDTDSISEVLTSIKNIENLQEQITCSLSLKSTLENEIVKLQSYVNELKQGIAVSKSVGKYFDNKLKTVKSEIVHETERYEQLKGLCRDIYDMEAYEHLQNTLIANIEIIIFDKDKFIPLIMMGVFEALKEDPQKRTSLNEYCKKFKNEKLAVDNIDSRIAYLKSSEFWNDTSIYFQKLAEVYSEEVFAFVLKKYYKSFKLNQEINNHTKKTVSFS